MENKTITLWTRQVPQVWQTLAENGTYHCKEEYIHQKNDTISDYYLELYRWYTREARKYLPVSEDTPYPIWLSLEEEMMLQPVENTVILKLEIPASWERIFDLPAEAQYHQAACWQLNKEWKVK